MELYRNGWLAFELNVLRRLKFASVAIPLLGEPHLGMYLKRWKVLVSANDPLQSNYVKAVASIENNSKHLSEKEVEVVLEDAYVPRYRLKNPALRKWFSETDSWWFDNVRQNIERLESTMAKAVASSLVMQVGDYVHSFSEETLHLRQPLSKVFKRLWLRNVAPVNNGKQNFCQNKHPKDYIAEHKQDFDFVPDLMFLRLPKFRNSNLSKTLGWKAWREEWLRQSDDFWEELEHSFDDKLNSKVQTKSEYLNLLKDFLETASNIEKWAIAHLESDFVSMQEVIETVNQVRKVETVFTKDFSEFTGRKAVIITA